MAAFKGKTDNTKCIRCGIFIRKTSGTRKIVEVEEEADFLTKKLGTLVTVGTILCDKCRKIVSAFSQDSDESDSCTVLSQLLSQSSVSCTQSSTEDPTFSVNYKEVDFQYTVMPIPRTISTHKYCFLCGAEKNLIIVPFEARMQSFIKMRIFIPNGNRCCRKHCIKKQFFEEELKYINIFSNTSSIEINELSRYLDQMSIMTESNLTNKIGDFTLSEERLKVFTGLTWKDIQLLQSMMTTIRNSECRTVTEALATFLFKLRSGNSNNMIATILGFEREQQVSDFCASVMNSFEKDILPDHFGFTALSREDLIKNHTSAMAQKLFNINNQLALILDGTYIRHEKSTNNEYQRKSYSGQKNVHLCKPFTICTTNGYVVEMLGPFYANQNDADITKIAFRNPNGLKSILKKGDILIVDRGFRDAVQFLEEQGFRVVMPALKGQRLQLTTEESNYSRQVTKVRWVVEAVHGVLSQKFRLLHHKLDNKLLKNVSSYCRIACFLNNNFGKRLNSDIGMSDEIVDQIEKSRLQENTLAAEVHSEKLSRRKLPFQNISSATLLDFPEMTERDLKILFTGSYQLSQTVSYLAELMDEDNNINLQYLKTNNNIIKIQVRSRHIKRKTYKCFINYKPNTIGFAGILRYCCECPNGLRTVGCCSHVAAIIYYLSHARYLSKIIRPAEILTKLFNVEEVHPVINEDSDED